MSEGPRLIRSDGVEPKDTDTMTHDELMDYLTSLCDGVIERCRIARAACTVWRPKRWKTSGTNRLRSSAFGRYRPIRKDRS